MWFRSRYTAILISIKYIFVLYYLIWINTPNGYPGPILISANIGLLIIQDNDFVLVHAESKTNKSIDSLVSKYLFSLESVSKDSVWTANICLPLFIITTRYLDYFWSVFCLNKDVIIVFISFFFFTFGLLVTKKAGCKLLIFTTKYNCNHITKRMCFVPRSINFFK